MAETKAKKKRYRSLAQIRNLTQYRDLSDEELKKVHYRLIHGDFEERIKKVAESFEEDYDLSDMTANDRLSLNELARIFVLLDDMEKALKDEVELSEPNWARFGKINKIAAQLRDDASKLQKDLNITRKARQETGAQTVVDFIKDLKARAKHFMDNMLYEIYCPKCKMLLAKVWCTYPKENNVLELVCGREGCGYKFSVNIADLPGKKNLKDTGPPI